MDGQDTPCWPGGHAAGAAAVSLRTPRKRGFDSHGGVFDHLESTSCKQDKGAKVSRVPVFGLAQLSMGMAGEEEIRGQMQSNTKHMDWVAYC